MITSSTSARIASVIEQLMITGSSKRLMGGTPGGRETVLQLGEGERRRRLFAGTPWRVASFGRYASISRPLASSTTPSRRRPPARSRHHLDVNHLHRQYLEPSLKRLHRSRPVAGHGDLGL